MSDDKTGSNKIATAILFVLLILVGSTSYYVYANVEAVTALDNANEFCTYLGFVYVGGDTIEFTDSERTDFLEDLSHVSLEDGVAMVATRYDDISEEDKNKDRYNYPLSN